MAMQAVTACPLQAQCGQPGKEYVRLGGRVIAIENYQQLAAPTFSPSGGTVSSPSVTVSGITGAVIYYTTDGTIPSCSSAHSPSNTLNLTVISGETVKAFAVQSGLQDSPVNSATYTLGTSQVTLSPSSFSFGYQQLAVASSPQTFTLTNSGTLALTNISILAGGDFALTNITCGSGLAAGLSCTIPVTFTPTVLGPRGTPLTVTYGTTGSQLTAALSGTGAGETLSSTNLSFGNQNAGSSSSQTVTLNYSGSSPLSIGGISIAPTTPAEFTQANTCGAGVASGGTCTITVTFTPSGVGAWSAALNIADNSAGSPHSVSLSGSGTGQTQVLPPAFSIPSDTIVVPGASITITAPSGASILYTTDATNPITSLTAHLVTSPFTFSINSGMTLGAVSRQAGMADSAVTWGYYGTSPVTLLPTDAVTLTSGQFTTFMMSASEGDQWSSPNDYLIMEISPVLGQPWAGACNVQYQPYTSTLYLTLDDGASWASAAIGSNTVLSNSQCTLNLAGAAALRQGTALTVSIPVAFNSSFAGVRYMWLDPYEGFSTWYYFSWDTVQANSVTVTPGSVSLYSGQPQQFTGSVANQSNTAVNWSMTPQVGTLSGSGQYSAPGSITTQQVVTLTATSQADATKFATATATLIPGGPVIPADLHLTNLTILSGSPTYQATHSITADTNFVVGGSASVTFTAGSSITLDPGFHATSAGTGTTFHAVIQGGIL